MITPSAPPSGTTSSAVIANDLFLFATTEFSDSRPMPPKRSCEVPRTSCGRPARSGLKRSKRRSSSGRTLYFAASIRKRRCSSCSFSGLSRGEVVRLRPVVRAVELPDVVVERRHLGRHPGNAVPGDSGPALVVDAAVAEHLEVLRRVAIVRVGVVERVRHRDALERPLLHAVDAQRAPAGRPPRAPSPRRRSRDGTASGSRPSP